MRKLKLIIPMLAFLMLLAANSTLAYAEDVREHTSTKYDYTSEYISESEQRLFLKIDVPSAKQTYQTYTPVVCDTSYLSERSAFSNLPDNYYASNVVISGELKNISVVPKSPTPSSALTNTKPFFEPNEYAINVIDPKGTYKKSLVIDEYAEFASLDISINSQVPAIGNISEKGYGAGNYNYSKSNENMCVNIFCFGTDFVIDPNNDTRLDNTNILNTLDDIEISKGEAVAYILNKDGSAELLVGSVSTEEGEVVSSRTINRTLSDAKNIRVYFKATSVTSNFDTTFLSVAINSSAYYDAFYEPSRIVSGYNYCKTQMDTTTNAMPVIENNIVTGHIIFTDPTELMEKTIASKTDKYEVIYRYIRLFWYETNDPSVDINELTDSSSKELYIKQGYSGNYLLSLYDDFHGIINVYPTFEAIDSTGAASGVIPIYDDFIDNQKQHGFLATEDSDIKSVYSEQLLIPAPALANTSTYLSRLGILRPSRILTQTWLYNLASLKTKNNECYYWFNINNTPTKSACGLYGLPNGFELLPLSSDLLTENQTARNMWLTFNTLPKFNADYLRITLDVEVFESEEKQAQGEAMISRGSIEPLYLYYPLTGANKSADSDKDITIIR